MALVQKMGSHDGQCLGIAEWDMSGGLQTDDPVIQDRSVLELWT